MAIYHLPNCHFALSSIFSVVVVVVVIDVVVVAFFQIVKNK